MIIELFPLTIAMGYGIDNSLTHADKTHSRIHTHAYDSAHTQTEIV